MWIWIIDREKINNKIPSLWVQVIYVMWRDPIEHKMF